MNKKEFEKILFKGIEDDTVNIIIWEGYGEENKDIVFWVESYVKQDEEIITIECSDEFETLEQAKKVQNKQVAKVKKWITGRDYLKLNIEHCGI